MPELPEIEHLARALRPELVGRGIVGIGCRQPRMLNLPAEEFAARARGRIVEVTRRGKSCLLCLADGSIWLHLGLGGLVALTRAHDGQPQLTIAIDDGLQLVVDKVFMGHAHFLDGDEARRRWTALGSEPLDDDFTPERLQAILDRKAKQSIKALLMDQSLIAGIGNVYSDEILHAARIHPRRAAGGLDGSSVGRLHAAMRGVLVAAIDLGGATDVVDPTGRAGRYEMRVHGAEACPDCGALVHRAPIGGRTAYYCSACQVE